MYALVDCNNFYVSCERLFNPKIRQRPVIVLSNNDGCAIARSDEAKAIGIDMGTPAFMLRDVIKEHNVAVYSSNYTLYGDVSDRVMQTLKTFVPGIEVYSIDEAFLDMHDMEYIDLLKLGMTVRKCIKKNIGIPVTIGIAPTKTLAKMANRFAKKKHKDLGVYWVANDSLAKEILAFTNVEDIWGIGHQYSTFLLRNGYKTALDLVKAPEEWIRKTMTVKGQRLLNELKGIPSITWDPIIAAKKNICTSRSFGQLQTNKLEIKEALCNYAASCAFKLRQQNSCCRKVHVFVQTNPHRTQDKQYFRSITVQLDTASCDSAEIIKQSLKGFEIIFREGYSYLKCGVIVMDIIPSGQVQASLFSLPKAENKTLMETMDKVNGSLGKDIVRLAVQGFEKRYKLKAAHLSPCYTTNINDILKVQI